MKFAFYLLVLLLFGPIAHAATLISTASGNIDATGTWNVVDTTGTNAFMPNDGGFGSWIENCPSYPGNCNWTTSSTSLQLQYLGPGWSVSGWFVTDLTSGLPIGTASSVSNNAWNTHAPVLNLTAAATNAGNSGDLLAITASNVGLTALTTSFQGSGNSFNLASETVNGFAVKLATSPASGPSGTMTAEIVDASNANAVVCHQVVNVADLPVGAQAGMSDGGWVPFTCIEGTFVTNNAHNYQLWAECSTTCGVSLWTNGTTAFFSHLVITTATQTGGAAAGDKLIVAGQLTGAGTHNGPFTVAIETTAFTNYGVNSTVNNFQDPSIAVGWLGTLAFNNAASTNYQAEFIGMLEVYNGGTLSVGTNAAPIPSTGTAVLKLNAGVEDDTGIIFKNSGTLNIAGVARTSGDNVMDTQLSTTANTGATSLSVADTTGWLSGDQVVLAGTDLPAGNVANSHYETVTLSGNASGTTIPISATLHSHTAKTISYTGYNNVAYNMPMNADALLLTRNVTIQGSGNSTPGYLFFQPGSHANIAWAAFNFIGGVNNGQNGFNIDTGPSGSFSMTYSVIENSIDGGLWFGYQNLDWGGSSSASQLLVQNVGLYNVGQTNTPALQVNATINPFSTIDHLTQIVAGGATQYDSFDSGAPNVTNITCADCGINSGAFQLNSLQGSNQFFFNGVGWATDEIGRTYGSYGSTFGPVRIYNSNGYSIVFGSPIRGTISGAYLWNNTVQRMEPNNFSHIVLDPYYDYEPTNTFGIYGAGNSAGGAFIARNGFIGYTTGGVAALTLDGNMGYWEFDNFDLCPTAAENSAFDASGCGTSVAINNDPPLDQVGTATVVGRNTSMSATNNYPTFIRQTSWAAPPAFITMDCPTCASRSSNLVPNHAAWLPNGTITIDSTIFHSSSTPYSTRMTPVSTVFAGYISGYTLTITDTYSGIPQAGSGLSASGLAAGTNITAAGGLGGCPPCLGAVIVTVPQTLGSSGSPVVFQQSRDYIGIRLQSAPQYQGVKGAVVSGHTGTACVWIRESSHLDASGVDYAGDAPRLMVRADPAMGVTSDTVLATFSGSTVGAWQQVCGTTPTAPADGMFELFVDCDENTTAAVAYNGGTPGWINVADWSFVQN